MNVFKMRSTLIAVLTLCVASAAQAKTWNYEGDTPVHLSYTGTNEGKVVACVLSSLTLIGAVWGCGESDKGDDYRKQKSIDKELSSQVAVRVWGEGKVLVNYSVEGAKGCLPLRKNYVGYENAYRAYNLYEMVGDPRTVDPSVTQPVASLSADDSSATIVLFEPIEVRTRRRDFAFCEMKIQTTAALDFEIQD